MRVAASADRSLGEEIANLGEDHRFLLGAQA
jgi:hypothetical protein